MSRAEGRAKDAPANAEPEPEAEKLVEQDPYDKLEGQTVEEAVRGGFGGGDNYPYLDKTAMPLHERDLPMNSDAYGPSQSDLNPAFTPKPEDGGPSKELQGEGVIEGTEPNADEKALAAAENSGQEGAVEAVQESIDAGKAKQMDAEKVTQEAQERAPKGVDAATGQPEGTATAPGAPSGMKADSKTGDSKSDGKSSVTQAQKDAAPKPGDA